MRNILIVFLLLLFTLQAEDEYQLGEGVQVGSLPLFVGGYFSLDYTNKEDYERYRVDDIAFLAYGGYEKFSYMAELEYKEFYAYTTQDGESSVEKDETLYVERLYLDYSLDENYLFRVGKYNSTVGFWNLLPVNVLRETTSNPVSTYAIFPKFTTGIDASYTSYSEGELKLNLMLQNNESISDEYNNFKEVDKHFGFGISYGVDEYTLKFNSGYFHKNKHPSGIEDYSYAVLAAKYETEDYQVLAEVSTQRANGDFSIDYAGYLQGLYRFTPQHIVVMRGESYDDNMLNEQDDIAIFGYTYRPLYPIAIKTEYQFHSIEQNNQFLFSFSVMF